jgi:hypothetical protein
VKIERDKDKERERIIEGRRGDERIKERREL